MFNVAYYGYIQNMATVNGEFYCYRKYGVGAATSCWHNVDEEWLRKRCMYYEANKTMYTELDIYNEQKETLNRIEAQQIYATASWIFAPYCPLSYHEKIEHCKRMVEEYKYGNLISVFPMNNVGILYRPLVKCLIQKKYRMFIDYGGFLRRMQMAKNRAKEMLRK